MDEKINEYYDSFAENNIHIEKGKFSEIKSLIFKNGDDVHVAINYDLINNSSEELCVLAEEKAHYDVGITPNNHMSNSYSDKLVRSKNEHRAKKLAISRLLPKDKLFSYMKNHPDFYSCDIAEHFGVTETFVREALCLYSI